VLFFQIIFTPVSYQINLSTSCAQHCFCSRLHLECVRKRRLWLFLSIKSTIVQ